MKDEILYFIERDIDNIFDEIWEAEVMEKSRFPTPVDEPKAFIWGGPPGAGKSSSMSSVSKEFLDNNSLIISGDDYRKYHPNFKKIVKVFGDQWSLKTSDWSAAVFRRVLDRASELKYNLQIEGTMRTSHLPLKTADQLLRKGYEVNFAVALAPKDVCWSSTIERYNRQKENGEIPRAVDKNYMNDFFRNFSKNVVEIFNSKQHNMFLVYTRHTSNTIEKELTKDYIDELLNDNTVNRNHSKKIEEKRGNILKPK